jgi:DNA repair exonuclease SbcCD ATPase subunit
VPKKTDSKEERNKYFRDYYQKNREKYIAKARKWRAENPDKVKDITAKCHAKIKARGMTEKELEIKRAAGRAYRERNIERERERGRAAYHKAKANGKYTPEWHRAQSLKENYGMSVETYEAILNAQGGVCAICGEPQGKRRLAVDHSHTTGKNRGLLCMKCNVALERFDKYPDYGDKVLAYLTKYLEQIVRS